MIDLLLVLAFVAYSVTAGFRARSRASRNLEEYFLAGRSMPGWQAGFSMAATQYAADTPLLVTGLVATAGIFAVWRLWIYGLAFLMMAFLLGPAWRRAGVITDAELTEVRYSGRAVGLLRALKAVYFGTVINCTVLAMVLVAATRICEAFLPWHDWLPAGLFDPVRNLAVAIGHPFASAAGAVDPFTATADNLISIVLILAFVGLYSATGGLRSVIATDVVQFSLAMVATLAYAIVVVSHAGGLDGLLDGLARARGTEGARHLLGLAPSAGEALLPFLTLLGLQWFFQMNSDGTGYLAQRTMACRTDRDARLAGFIFTWAQIFFRSLLWLPIAVGLLILYPVDPSRAGDVLAAARELTFVQGIRDLLPVGIRGLMLTGMLAALASTVDTHLNWGASYWANDLYKGTLNERMLGRKPRPREMVLVARLSNLLILGIALAIMSRLQSIQSAWHVSLLFGAGIGSVLVLRWFWERINVHAEIAAIAISLAAAPFILVHVEAEWRKLLIMSALSTVAVVATALLTPGTRPEILEAFYRRVRPPGRWRGTAARAGLDPGEPGRAFRTDAFLILAVAASLYLALIGGVRVLLPLPGEPRAVGAVFLGVAAALAPLWWRRVWSRHSGAEG